MSGGLGDLPDSILGANPSNQDNFLKAIRAGEKKKQDIAIPTLQLKKKFKPPIDAHKIALTLVDVYKAKRKANEDMLNLFNRRQIIPVARQISEWFLKQIDWNIMNREAVKEYPDKAVFKNALAFLHDLSDPVLLISGIAAYPELYSSCEQCLSFLHDNHIHVLYVVPISKCADCKYSQIQPRTCSFFNAKIFGIWIDDEDCNSVITELFAKNRLTASNCQELKNIPDANDRLSKALKIAARLPIKRSDWTRPIKKEKTNSLAISAANFDGRENAVKSAMDILSNGKTITEVKNHLAINYKDSDGILNDAIARVRIITADTLDTCLTEKYIFSPGLELIKAEKCRTCDYAGTVTCNKHDVIFADTTMTMNLCGLNQQSPEAQEILAFFANSKIEMDFNMPTRKPSLKIELENIGKDLVVDVGKKSTIGENFEIGTIFHDIPEMTVDVLPSPQNEDNLEILGLAGNEGFDLTNIF
jgi:hypothetical protein